MNLYQYCNNSPLNYTDPSGLCKEFFKGMGWGTLKTAALLAGTALAGTILITAFPILVPVLTAAAPWLLGMGAFFGGTQIGLSIGGLGWGGQRLSARQRGERLGIGALTAGAAILGAANVSKPTHVQKGAQGGENVYRQWGGKAEPYGSFWSPKSPSTAGYENNMGIPTKAGANTGEFISTGTLKPGAIYYEGPATGINTNKGGGIEYIIPNSQENIILNSVYMPDQ